MKAITYSILIFSLISGLFGEADSWKKWLAEVEPIMTRVELSVVKLLKTEEERIRFRQAFWKARDTNPATPENEYRIEYSQRLHYVNRFLKGPRSDRGRIYLILGKPTNKTDYSGHHSLVDCELWNYELVDRPGLLPFMNLVFYRPHNTGDFQLYHPGIHGPRSLLSPQYANNINNRLKAYREIKVLSSELALASLSIVPGEGDARSGMSISSSNFALNRIYSLPEREASAGYARKFLSPTGHVEVSHSTQEIRGYGYIGVNRKNGIPIIHYAIMPQTLVLKAEPGNDRQKTYAADLQLLISVENLQGTMVYENKRDIRFKSDLARKRKIERQKVVFRDFTPLIEGQFDVTVTFINNATREFYRYKQRVDTRTHRIAVLTGYDVKAFGAAGTMPFSHDNFFLLTDPRGTFNRKDFIQGMVWSPGPPEVVLENAEQGNAASRQKMAPVVIPVQHQGNDFYKIHFPLSGVPDGKYRLTFHAPGEGGEVRRLIQILPDYIGVIRPFVMEKPAPAGQQERYFLTLARQYLNTRDYDRAEAYFKKAPFRLWNPAERPFVAQAFYMNKNWATVMELLEPDNVKKTYPVLQMLANSSIELKHYPKALKYLKQLRKYGDTVEINHLLASTYLCMGNREKAKLCYDHARRLQTKQRIQGNHSKKQKNR